MFQRDSQPVEIVTLTRHPAHDAFGGVSRQMGVGTQSEEVLKLDLIWVFAVSENQGGTPAPGSVGQRQLRLSDTTIANDPPATSH